MVSGPKTVKFYPSGHALNSLARIDRFAFLMRELELSQIPLPSSSRYQRFNNYLLGRFKSLATYTDENSLPQSRMERV